VKSKLFLSVVIFLLSIYVNAQSKDEKQFKIGAGALLGLPVGDVSGFTSLAYGIDIMGEYAVAPSVALTLSFGYLDFAVKSGYSGSKMGSVPLLAGAKYHFSDQLYGSFQAGLSIGTASNSFSEFTFAPGVGYKISNKFDLMLKYQSALKGWGTSFLGIRAGINF
jgi:hypothetical protein